MRLTGWTTGLLMVVGATSGVLAADYSGPYRHHRSYNPRGVIGECVRTRVGEIGAVPAAPGVPAIRYVDGVVQAYDGGMLGHVKTRPGDPIQLCLVSFSRDCGENTLPGRTYATGNLRTGAAWTLPDIRSSCRVR